MGNGKKLKITLLVRYFTIGGLERVVIALSNEYVRRGYETQIVIMSRGKRNSLITELDSKVEILFLDGNPFVKVRKLRNAVKGRFVHIHFGDGKIHPWIRLQLIGMTKTVTYHSVYRHKRNWFLNKMDYLCNRKLKKVIAVSDAVKDFCTKDIGLNPDKVLVIKNGIKIEDRKRPLQVNVQRLEFLVLCSLYSHKNHKEIIEQFARLKKDGFQNWHLTFIGDGPCMAELFLQARNLGIENDITWLGAVWNQAIVDSIFNKMDILLSASTYEGFPISILEAMRYHIPLMLSDIPPHREAGGDIAYYFQLGDYESFRDAFVQIGNSAMLLENRGNDIFKRLQNFDINSTVEQYLMVYNDIWQEGQL